MVFLNDRILYGHDGDGQAISLEMITGSLHPVHLATLPGPADVAQEQLALEGCNGAKGSTSGQTAVPPKERSCPARRGKLVLDGHMSSPYSCIVANATSEMNGSPLVRQ